MKTKKLDELIYSYQLLKDQGMEKVGIDSLLEGLISARNEIVSYDKKETKDVNIQNI